MAKNTSKKSGGKNWRNSAAAMAFNFGANVKPKGSKGKRKPPGGGSK